MSECTTVKNRILFFSTTCEEYDLGEIGSYIASLIGVEVKVVQFDEIVSLAVRRWRLRDVS